MGLRSTPKKSDKEEMEYTVQALTNDPETICIFQPDTGNDVLIAEFTIDKARQMDVVDKIAKEFGIHMKNYGDISISFPKSRTTKKRDKTNTKYTPKQGQYLSFIYYYTKLNRIPPAEADFQRYFGTSPPTVHNMICNLEKKGFIARTPRTPRSIRLLLSRSKLPDLE